jgi:hypothetical protein
MYKYLKYFYILFLLCLVSCSSDDTDEFQDAVTLNVMNEVNGKTFIGNSDVFLNTIVRYKIILYKKFMPPDKPLYQ